VLQGLLVVVEGERKIWVDHNNRAQVAWLHLVHVWEGAGSKVIVAYGVGEPFLKLAGRGMAAGSDAVVDGGEVSGVLLELAGMSGDEISGGKWFGEIWDKESSLHEIKRKCGLHTMHYVEGGIAS
jgi:hypothetical protein